VSQAAPRSSSAGAAAPEEPGLHGLHEGEVVDAVPVLAEDALPRVRGSRRELAREARAAGAQLPAVQAAVVAAGGFVAGAAVAGLVHRRHGRSPALSGGGRVGRALGRGGTRKRAAGAELMQIVGTRTFLVDVHVLGTPGADR
jgi:hypothetical protein